MFLISFAIAVSIKEAPFTPAPSRSFCGLLSIADPCQPGVNPTPSGSNLTRVLIYQLDLYRKGERPMCKCHYCGREFEGSQNVKAHLRRCPNYLKFKDSAAKATSPNTPLQGPALATAHDPPVLTLLSEAMAQFATQIAAQCSGPVEATRLRQKRESLLTLLLIKLVDWYRSPEGVVTPEMAAAAKVAMLDELRPQPIENLSDAELT